MLEVKVLKRVLACALAVMLVIPSISASAEEPQTVGMQVTGTEGTDPTDTGSTDPTDTGSTDLVDTGSTDPTNTGSTDPTDTGSTDPTDTGSIDPVDTGSTDPTDTGSTDPADTGSTDPTDTGSTDPADTGSTDPADTGSTDPADTGSTDPADTGSTDPTDTGSTDPTDTGSTDPTDTGSTNPADTGGTNPTDTGSNELSGMASEGEDGPEIDEVQFNTGNHVWSVVNEEAFLDLEVGDVCFAEDGSYTINLEDNAFFPYEVQFTHDGEVTNEWFMSLDDSVEIGGHTFYVSSYYDGTALTQLTLKVGGETVVVYPEAKEFTDDEEGGIAPASLIPLKTQRLSSVDLSEYTPIELTMVEVAAVLGDETGATDSTKIAWKQYYDNDDDYTVSGLHDKIDLSKGISSYGGSTTWEMIVGDGDQLNPNNVRYIISVDTPSVEDWLSAAVYTEDENGNRENIEIADFDCSTIYRSYSNQEGVYINVNVASKTLWNKSVYTGMTADNSKYAKTNVHNIKVVKDWYDTVEDATAALASSEITNQIFPSDLTGIGSGYQMDGTTYFSLIAYDSAGNIIGILPMSWWLGEVSLEVFLYKTDLTDWLSSSNVFCTEESVSFGLSSDYALNGQYTLMMDYEKGNGDLYPDITAVYLGKYSTIAEATAAGAENIKDSVLESGYTADFSKGIWFTVFAGEDGNKYQSVFSFQAITERRTGSDVDIQFNGLKDSNGQVVPSYVINSKDDSYAEKNYITILVGEDTDLSKQYAPVFYLYSNATLYAEGSSTPEVSGESLHSFADGPVQYTVSAENKEDYKNYWVQIKKADLGDGQLYISSLKDPEAKTRVENGVTYSNRELMLDYYHNYVHDICLVNIGTTELPKLSAELVSDVLELDPYWSLSGNQSLQGFSTVESSYGEEQGELPNLAKIRLRAKDGVEDGTDISGTLTIKSDGRTLMVLTLTGMVGDPRITTSEIPEAVKYVPYGTMIQNNNKYSWVKTAYELTSGKLPEGMELRPNGELYGVPQNTGTFKFTVRAKFTSTRGTYSFPTSRVTLTLTVKENTNANVYNETDTEYGYTLETPIGVETTPGSYDFYLANKSDTLFVSEGLYNEFIDLWLNGEKLERGVDYTAESGSTRITVSSQTLKNKAAQTGNNTIAAEFRVDGDMDKDLRRTAQNFHLDKTSSGSGSGSSSGSSSGSGSGGSSSDEESTGGSGGSTAPAVVTISGRLVDADNHPLAGMTVELHSTPRVTTTDANGNFLFTDVEFGQHQLFVKDANGTVLASKAFEIWENSTVSLNGDVFNAPRGTTISVTVRLADGALAFSNVVFTSAPATGDVSDPASWMLLALVSCAALAGAVIYKRRTAMHR